MAADWGAQRRAVPFWRVHGKEVATIPRRMVPVNELVGVTEAAQLLGWSRQRIAAYHGESRAGMPKPVVRLAGTPVWLKSDLIRWARERGYRLPMDATDGADATDGPGGADPTARRPMRSSPTSRAQNGRKGDGPVPDTTPPRNAR